MTQVLLFGPRICNTALARSWVVLLSLDAQPTDGEQETFEEVQRVLRNSEPILEEIQCYKGAGREIREVSIAGTADFG